MAMMSIFDWRELPHPEIWAVDTEFYPGAGLANGGREGDPITPLCLVALEMRSGRLVRLWQDEFGPFPPYRLDAGALIVSFMASAEFGVHLALGWGQPACTLDPYVEFRHYTNDGRVKSGDREKGFYGLAGALRYFCEDEIDTAHKDDMRDRIMQGPPFTADERQLILDYCETDVRALARLVNHIAPTIRSLPHAMFRAQVMWPTACQERRGVPLDLAKHGQLLACWDDIQIDLMRQKDRAYGCYEIEDGKPHWRRERFAKYIQRNNMVWPRRTDGSYDERDETFREMAGRYSQIETLRELRYSLSKLRLNALSVGSDGRNRTVLGPYGTKTARHAPSNSRYIFGPAKWLRHLITPPPGRALIHRDYCQQEVRIAAVLSGDAALLHACESGDVYLGIARQLGFIRESMTPSELGSIRSMFKTVVLGIQYGLGPYTLAVRTGVSLAEAAEILARLRARFRTFEAFAEHAVDRAGLDLEIGTQFDWYMQCPSNINPRTVRNFPIQSSGSEILHVAVVLAERRGIKVVAPVHDAIMIEADLTDADDAALALDRLMRDAAAVVLRGYELPTDQQIIRPGQRFFDKRGIEMWETVERLVTKLEERRA
jgi:hypothetical protein